MNKSHKTEKAQEDKDLHGTRAFRRAAVVLLEDTKILKTELIWVHGCLYDLSSANQSNQ